MGVSLLRTAQSLLTGRTIHVIIIPNCTGLPISVTGLLTLKKSVGELSHKCRRVVSINVSPNCFVDELSRYKFCRGKDKNTHREQYKLQKTIGQK